MNKKLKIRDLTMRDGQQSLFATRMRQEQIERLLPYYKTAKFYAIECWGGAIPDSIMRFLNEDPWYRLESINAELKGISHLTALSRGRNLFGYNPYPDSVIDAFNTQSVKSGITIMRIFDCLNDLENMKTTIKSIKAAGGIADCAISYTVDSKLSLKQKYDSLIAGKGIPEKIFTIDYFINKAKALEEMGADMITVKDMAGLIPPAQAGEIIRRLKAEVKLPIDLHTHCTPGYGLGAMLMAIINGVDIVDTNILNFAGGPGAPSIEVIKIFADKLGIEIDVDLESIYQINQELKKIRKELEAFDPGKDQLPIDFDIRNPKLPKEIDSLFDSAIKYAKENNEEKLLESIHLIEMYFNFPEPDEMVKHAEIPGGMYTNMVSQLKQLKLDHLMEEVLATVPIVRLDAGCPPLVTPTSQIVGAQTVNCVIDKINGKPFYTNVSKQFHNLVKGSYGNTPAKIDPAFREKICGHKDAMPYDVSKYEKQANPVLEQFGGVKLAKNPKEEMLMELFPEVAIKYLMGKIEAQYKKEQSDKRRKEEQTRKEENAKRMAEIAKNMDKHLLNTMAEYGS